MILICRIRLWVFWGKGTIYVMVKLNLREKLVLLLLFVAIIPFLAITLYWYHASQSSLKNNAVTEQKSIVLNAAYTVNNYITSNVQVLRTQSQSIKIQSFNENGVINSLQNLIKQNTDIQTLTLANSNGQVILDINRKGVLNTHTNISNESAYRAVTSSGAKQFIEPITFNNKQPPILTIAVPIAQSDSKQNLSQTNIGPSRSKTTNKNLGVLIETTNFNNLWHRVLSQDNIGNNNIYIVDSRGNLITYRNMVYQKDLHYIRQGPIIQAFVKNPLSQIMPVLLTTENGIKVLSSYKQINITKWGIIAEEPTSAIFASINHTAIVSSISFIVVVTLVLVIAYFVSRRLTKPILDLANGITLISQGKLDTRITNNSNDEIGKMIKSFNKMSFDLGLLVQKIRKEANNGDTILNNVSEGIIAVDANEKVLLANVSAASLIGKKPDDMIGQQLKNLYNWTENDSNFKPDLSQEQHYREITLTNNLHRISYIDILINPIDKDPSGIKTIILIIDNTKERELDNMKVDFVSMAAHELRTPLTAIRGYLDLMAHDEILKSSDSMRNYFEHMEANSLQLVSLINNLLNVSRIERNALRYNPEKLSWNEVLRKVISDQQFMAKSKKISLVYEGPEEDVFILAEQITIQEVINNLISNSINYTDIGGHVIVKLELNEEKVITKVIDDGIGIPQANQPYLFTKFYRVRSGLNSGSGGTGLGLFIAKSIVEMHGGSISVESEEGKGSTFTVILPKFNEDRYNEIIRNRPFNTRHKYGWITKDTSR